jgi:hypothetical protein
MCVAILTWLEYTLKSINMDSKNIFTVVLSKEEFDAYHANTLPDVVKDSLDDFIVKMTLSGHEVFILPPCTIEKISGPNLETEETESEHSFFVISVDVGICLLPEQKHIWKGPKMYLKGIL